MLQTLNANIDNKRLDKPTTLEEAMGRYDWLKQKKSMKSKYNLLIKNDT